MNVSAESSTQESPYTGKTCPFLGLLGDPETRFGYPSMGNRCHRLKPIAKITPAYQETWCLSGDFMKCAVYQGAARDHLPEGIDATPQVLSPFRAFILAVIFVIMVASAIALFYFIWSGNRGKGAVKISLTATELAGDLASTPQSTSAPPPSSPSPTTKPSPTITLSPTTSPTPSPSLTSTPAPPTQAAALETPFGPGGEYILHKVATGESLNNIAAHYRMSAAVLIAINEIPLGGSLVVGKVLVVIPSLSNNPGLPVFHPTFLDQDTSVSELAQQYSIHAEDLRFYNSLSSSDIIPAGRWIIIPLPPSLGP